MERLSKRKSPMLSSSSRMLIAHCAVTIAAASDGVILWPSSWPGMPFGVCFLAIVATSLRALLFPGDVCADAPLDHLGRVVVNLCRHLADAVCYVVVESDRCLGVGEYAGEVLGELRAEFSASLLLAGS